MRTRFRLLTVCLVVLASLASARPASAGFWAWLEEFSGPGPLKGYTLLYTQCIQDRDFKPSPIALDDPYHRRLIRASALAPRLSVIRADIRNVKPEAVESSELLKRMLDNPSLGESATTITRRAEELRSASGSNLFSDDQLRTALQDVARTDNSAIQRFDLLARQGTNEEFIGQGHRDKALTCFYFDAARYHASAGRGFDSVTAFLIDGGPSARLHDGVDIGGGVGGLFFNSGARKVTLTPLRIVLRPILIGVPEHHRREWMGFLALFWKETYVAGKLSNADFGDKGEPFSVDGEMIRSFGFNVDVSALTYLLRPGARARAARAAAP